MADVAHALARKLHRATDAALVEALVAIGREAGLFALLSSMSPASSEAIAARAGADPARVRAVLSALTVAALVDYDGARDRFGLEAALAPVLATKGRRTTLARALAPHRPLLARVLTDDAEREATMQPELGAVGPDCVVLAERAIAAHLSDDVGRPLAAALYLRRAVEGPGAIPSETDLRQRCQARGLAVRRIVRCAADPLRLYVVVSGDQRT